ncbi:MAG TPA: hypothetical protein PK580_00225 [Nitrosomonas halophila]|nr:hypothetical protein [Nitrosomonas halophila]
MRFEILNDNGDITNIIVASHEFVEEQFPGRYREAIYPSLPQIPQSCTALAGMLAIEAAGLSEAYQAWANSPDRTFAERAFIDKALTWRRDDPVLLAGAVALGLTDSQLDDLFILAKTIE